MYILSHVTVGKRGISHQLLVYCTRSEKHSKWHCSGGEKQINNDGRIIKLNINNIIKVSATANAINNNTRMVRLRSFRQVTGLPRCVDGLSDGYLEYASESSVVGMCLKCLAKSVMLKDRDFEEKC